MYSAGRKFKIQPTTMTNENVETCRNEKPGAAVVTSDIPRSHSQWWSKNFTLSAIVGGSSTARHVVVVVIATTPTCSGRSLIESHPPPNRRDTTMRCGGTRSPREPVRAATTRRGARCRCTEHCSRVSHGYSNALWYCLF